MGKTLKVLTVFIFLFSVFAFVMGVMNYNKRELLIGRTTMLERYVTSLALTIETEQPEFEGAPSHTEWDLDEVTDRANDDPAMSDFWGSYSNALEVSGQSFVRLGTEKNRQKLATYYQTEMVDGKPRIKKDFQGRPVTEGPDTMHDLLEDTLDRAKAQLERLNATRAELIKMRNALNEVAGLLNEEKKLRRENLSTITQLRQKIEELENTIVEKDNQIARLEREKAELQDTIASLNQQIEEKDQKIMEQETTIQRLKDEIDKLITHRPKDPGAAGTQAVANLTLAPGVKGRVIEVNRELSFVIVQLTPEAAAEITPNGTFAPVDMMVYRKGADGEKVIVTRVRILNPPGADHMTVAENLYGWEQTPVEIGDELVH